MNVLARAVKAITRAFFRLFYRMEIIGLENIPAAGPVVLAPNHVNYFDAPMLVGFVPRQVHFIAASNAFEVPVWSFLMRLYGTISVERGKADASAIKASLKVLKAGEVLGIFPEGTFTSDGHLEEAKLGAAHLALKTGAAIVPVTISGAFRSWPRMGERKRRMPRPWRIRIKFHEPIRVREEVLERQAADKEYARQLTQEIEERIRRTLEPSLRADARIDHLLANDAPPLRLYEMFPLFLALAASFLMGWSTGWFTHPTLSADAMGCLVWFLVIGLVYLFYLELDIRRLRQTVLTRAVRTYIPFVFVACYYPVLIRAIPLVAEVGEGDAAVFPLLISRVAFPGRDLFVAWLLVAYFTVLVHIGISLRYYHFSKYLLLQRFERGLLLTCYAALLAILCVPYAGSMFPLKVPPSAMGLAGRVIDCCALTRLVVFAFPVVIVMLTIYVLVFDWFHRRTMFWTMLLPAVSAVGSAVLLRGYPPGAVVICFIGVVLVLLYMRRVPMTAHDGRRV